MKNSVEIKEGKVFVNGKATTDPTLIGYAVLDDADNSILDISIFKPSQAMADLILEMAEARGVDFSIVTSSEIYNGRWYYSPFNTISIKNNYLSLSETNGKLPNNLEFLEFITALHFKNR